MQTMAEPTQFDELISVLKHLGVNFILVGGLAGMADGSNCATLDVDVVYDRSPQNFELFLLAGCTAGFALRLGRDDIGGWPELYA